MTLTAGLAAVSTVEQAAGIVTQLLGLAALAGVLAGVLGVGYRWYTGSPVPQRLAVFVGVGGVALYLGTTAALEAVVISDVEPTEVERALFNLGALLAGGGGAVLGRLTGDRFATGVLLWSPTQDADDVGRLAQTVGRVTKVQLPTAIDDASGYDPVPERTKQRLAGKRLVFPQNLTIERLGERLTERLKSDYGVGTVDVEFDEDGAVTHLAVGTRAAGIGSTLPPATNAVAIRADPGFSASTGDIVQVWETDPARRVLTGELRGVADDVATIAVDAGDTPNVDPTQRYRLVTLPVNDRPDREFASLLRAAEETFSSVTVEAGCPLHGLPVGALDLTITAIRPEAGEPVPFPAASYRLAPGDLCFVIARPAALRRLEAATAPLDPALASSSLPTDEAEPAEGISTAEDADTERDEPTGEDGLPADTDDSLAGEAASEEQTEPTAPDSAGDDSEIGAQATADSFANIKAQFGDDQASDDDTATAETEDTTPESDAGETATAETGEVSFDDLKSEFESGEAEWSEDESADEETSDVEVAFTDDSGGDDTVDTASDEAASDEETSEAESSEESEELVSLEEANITFDDEQETEPPTGSDVADASDALGDLDIDEDLQGDDEESVSDDIGDLEFDDDDEESDEFGDLGFEDDDLFETDDDADEDDDTDEESDDETDDESDESDDSGGGGGGSSFADLKAEFESGDADWEDDISDSPGGDMRLDE